MLLADGDHYPVHSRDVLPDAWYAAQGSKEEREGREKRQCSHKENVYKKIKKRGTFDLSERERGAQEKKGAFSFVDGQVKK